MQITGCPGNPEPGLCPQERPRSPPPPLPTSPPLLPLGDGPPQHVDPRRHGGRQPPDHPPAPHRPVPARGDTGYRDGHPAGLEATLEPRLPIHTPPGPAADLPPAPALSARRTAPPGSIAARNPTSRASGATDG